MSPLLTRSIISPLLTRSIIRGPLLKKTVLLRGTALRLGRQYSTKPQPEKGWFTEYTKEISERLERIDKRRIASIKWTLGGMALCGMGCGMGFWMFKDQINAHLGRGGAKVGRQIVGDKELQEDVLKNGKQLSEQLLNDPEVKEMTANFIKEAVEQYVDSEAFGKKFKEKLIEVIKSKEVKDEITNTLECSGWKAIKRPFTGWLSSSDSEPAPEIDSLAKLEDDEK